MQYIDIDKDAIPYEADIKLNGITYRFRFHYNAEGDFFTVDLERGEEMLAVGAKMTLGVPLFGAYRDDRFPSAPLVPLDIAGRAQRVGWAELGKSVLLYIDPEGVNTDE